MVRRKSRVYKPGSWNPQKRTPHALQSTCTSILRTDRGPTCFFEAGGCAPSNSSGQWITGSHVREAIATRQRKTDPPKRAMKTCPSSRRGGVVLDPKEGEDSALSILRSADMSQTMSQITSQIGLPGKQMPTPPKTAACPASWSNRASDSPGEGGSRI